MKRDANGPALSAIFVDYDNIYLSLKRKNEDAAKRFSKDAALWLRDLENGALITATSGFSTAGPRRIVLNRCYGNPVPRRNSHDNSTDMNSFPFIRHHFLRAGAEVVDCPPLTAQLKNSADIRIVMDVRDMITHDTYFDEFIILSSDADFTPLLHRLRAHARRTVIYANDQTASPYTAISDGEVRESDLLRLLLDARGSDRALTVDTQPAQLPQSAPPQAADHSLLRRDLANEAANLVRAAGQPVPLEALADRLVRQFGHDRTSGCNWAGMGGFRELLASYLPEALKISEQPPYVVFDTELPDAPQRLDASALGHRSAAHPSEPLHTRAPQLAPPQSAPVPPDAPRPLAAQRGHDGPRENDGPRLSQTPAIPGQPRGIPAPVHSPAHGPAPRAATPSQPPSLPPPQHRSPSINPPPTAQTALPAVAPPQMPTVAEPIPQPQQLGMSAAAVQQMVGRIYDACQAPAISPPEYRLIFDVMAQEISSRGLNGMQTLDSIGAQAMGFGIRLGRDDVRFILEVVSDGDEWFENGVSANLFASRFRNFVIARCRSTGLQLSAEEIDLIDHWFAGAEQRSPHVHAAPQVPHGAPHYDVPNAAQNAAAAPPAAIASPVAQPPRQQLAAPQHSAPIAPTNPVDIWWSTDAASGQRATGTDTGDDFPRIIRSRTRG